VARTFDAKKDALELASPLADLATKIGLRRESLRLDGEIALARALVEQAVSVYTRQFTAYLEACDAEPANSRDLAPPSLLEVVAAQESFRKMVDTYTRTLNAHAVPREVVVALVHRVRAIVQQQVPDTERQQQVLKQIGSINLPY
jgi:hypothetical protein